MSDLDQRNDRAAFESREEQRRHPRIYPMTKEEQTREDWADDELAERIEKGSSERRAQARRAEREQHETRRQPGVA